MLNKLSGALFSSVKSTRCRVLPVALLSLVISACSVTQEKPQAVNKQLNSETNKLYVDAVMQMKAGKTKKAQVLLGKVIRQEPAFSNAHVNMGILYLKMKMNTKAEAAFQQALKLKPNNKYALNQQAFLYRLNGDFTNAKTNYEKAIDIDPEYANAHLNLGILYDLYLYDLDKALAQYKKFNELTKGNNKQVGKWIVDLERRNKKTLSQK